MPDKTEKKRPNRSTAAQPGQVEKEVEKRVAARTEELQRTNAALQAEIAELKQALGVSDRARTEGAQTRAQLRVEGDNAHAEHRRLFDVLDTLPAMICLLTQDYRIAFANRAFRATFGESPERCYERCFNRSEPCGFCEAFETLKTGKPHRWEVKAPDGRLIDAYDMPFVDADGSLMVLEMDIDVTERKRMEKDLRETASRLSTALQLANLGVWTYDAGTDATYLDRRSQEVFGIEEEHPMSNEEIFDLIHPEDRARVKGKVLAALKPDADGLYRTQYRVIRSDGSQRGVSVHGRALMENRTTDKKVSRFVGTLKDISGYKQMEEDIRRSRDELELRVQERTVQLEESKKRYHDLANLLPETVFETDGFGYFTYANRHALETFGYTAADIRRGLHIRSIVTEKDYKRVTAKATRILKGRGAGYGEITVRRKDGSEFQALIHANSIEHKGQIVGLRGVATDLTESRENEAERQKLEEQLRQAQKMEAVGTLAGGIAHDFNNMLAVILGNAELAMDEIDGNEGPAHNIEQIVRASRRARDLVKQILTFSRKTKTGRHPLKLAPLVKETFKLLRGTLPSTIQMDLAVDIDSDTVVADPSQIQQVVMNLAMNAAHAMRDDAGILTVKVGNAVLRRGLLPDSETKPGSYVTLTVQDTGTGMTEQILQRIFDPFFTTKEPGQGTGMGLAVVYGIVKSHGGTIIVESHPDKGSKFTVFLPKAEGEPMQKAKTSDAVPLGKERILLVDDEPAVLEMTSNLLKRLGYHVSTVESPSEALSLFRSNPHRFDLIITDQTMPEITGLAFAREILKDRKDMPIILITGYSEVVPSERAQETGIREFVMKPVVKQELAETVRRVLDADANTGLANQLAPRQGRPGGEPSPSEA